jgi:hypothetical protein
MDILKKAEAITEFSTDSVTINSGLHDDFFSYNDLGIPLAISVNAGLCNLTDEGIKTIEETFVELCKEMEIDPTKEYNDYDEMLDESLEN